MAEASLAVNSDIPAILCMVGDEATAVMRGEDGPSEDLAERSGVLQALLEDSGLPGNEPRMGVELIDGKWDGSSEEGACPMLEPLDRLLDENDEESEVDTERERGVTGYPASVGSGRRHGETWTRLRELLAKWGSARLEAGWLASRKVGRVRIGVWISSSNSPA